MPGTAAGPQNTSGTGSTSGADSTSGTGSTSDGVLEVGLIQVTDRDAFVAAYRGVREVLASTPGCRSVRMTGGVESPERFVLLVEWDSVEAHLDNFRATDRFGAWRSAIGPFFAGPPVVEHFTSVE